MEYSSWSFTAQAANRQMSSDGVIVLCVVAGLLLLGCGIGMFFAIRWRMRFERAAAEQRFASGALTFEGAEREFAAAFRNTGMTWILFGLIKAGAVLLVTVGPLKLKFSYHPVMQAFDSVMAIALVAFGSASLRGSVPALKVGTLVAGIGAAVLSIQTLVTMVNPSPSNGGAVIIKMFIAAAPLIPAFIALQKLLFLNVAVRLRDKPRGSMPPPPPSPASRPAPPPSPSLRPPPPPRAQTPPPPPPAPGARRG